MSIETTSRLPKLSSIEILGIRIDKLTRSDAIKYLDSMVQNHQAHIAITLNTEMVMFAQHNARFKDIMNNASLIIPDSMGLIWASRILGERLPERLAGVDIVQHFVRFAGQQKYRLFLLGAAPGVAERVASIFRQRYPGIEIVGTYAGSPKPEEEQKICEMVNNSTAQILLVAYKVPEQEFWISRNINKLRVGVVINVGGTFDFIAGVTKRAPRWMQNVGLEWFFRLLQQPQRWRRMLALPRFAIKVLSSKFKAKHY